MIGVGLVLAEVHHLPHLKKRSSTSSCHTTESSSSLQPLPLQSLSRSLSDPSVSEELDFKQIQEINFHP